MLLPYLSNKYATPTGFRYFSFYFYKYFPKGTPSEHPYGVCKISFQIELYKLKELNELYKLNELKELYELTELKELFYYFSMMIKFIFAAMTFVSTFLGGLLAIKFRSKLNLIMGFVAGIILGVACFDILPDIIYLIKTYNFSTTESMVALMLGFMLFHILEKVFAMHHSHESDYPDHKHPHIGVLSALALIGHSLMDGIGIGVGFKLSESMGILVSLAVISHDFTDGMNTVTLMLLNHNSVKKARFFLILDAIAPVVGILLTIFFVLSNYVLFLYMSFFAGFLIYISASDILPEAHKNTNSVKLISLTLSGIILIFIITNILK